jgi:hypothetical protein
MAEIQVRLKLLEIVIPQASKVGITEPSLLIHTCTELEKYVLDSKQSEKSPDSQAKRPVGRPPKGTSTFETPSFLDPTRGG